MKNIRHVSLYEFTTGVTDTWAVKTEPPHVNHYLTICVNIAGNFHLICIAVILFLARMLAGPSETAPKDSPDEPVPFSGTATTIHCTSPASHFNRLSTVQHHTRTHTTWTQSHMGCTLV